MAEPRGLDAWLKLIAKQELPSLDTVIKAICDLSDDDDSNADDLTQIILRDADLTSQVLKVANSVHYNRSYSPIKTVSRAIVQIGYVDLKNIALASSLIDAFLGGKPREMLIQRLARSFHAAVQARAMARELSIVDSEEVFIGALLRHVAELALLATGRTVAERFIRERDEHPDQEHSLALEHLGVGISTLNKALIKEWGLGALLQQAAEQPDSKDPKIQAISLGSRISLTVHKGMGHTDMQQLCVSVSQLLGKSVAEVQELIVLNAEEASSVAATYGAERLLPAMPNHETLTQGEAAPEKTDHDFQRYMNRISEAIMDGDSLSRLLQLSVQALNLGSGFKRVAVSLLSVQAKTLEPAIVYGEGGNGWRDSLKLDLNKLRKGESLHDFLQLQQAAWFQAAGGQGATGVLNDLADGGDVMLAPMRTRERLLGVIYADAMGGGLSKRQYEEFQLIANQVNLYLQFHSPASG